MSHKITRIVGAALVLTVPTSVAAVTQQSGQVVTAQPKVAAADQAAVEFRHRGDGLVGMINGRVEPEAVFSKVFLAQRPPERLKGLATMIRKKFGAAVGVNRIEASSAKAATIYIDFEKGQLPFRVTLEDASPNLLIGLGVSG